MKYLEELHASDLLKAPQVIMLRLYTADGSGVTPDEIRESTGLPKSTISMAIEALRVAGISERRTPASDERRANIYLTDKGRGMVERMTAAMTDYVEDVKNRKGRVHP